MRHCAHGCVDIFAGGDAHQPCWGGCPPADTPVLGDRLGMELVASHDGDEDYDNNYTKEGHDARCFGKVVDAALGDCEDGEHCIIYRSVENRRVFVEPAVDTYRTAQ